MRSLRPVVEVSEAVGACPAFRCERHFLLLPALAKFETCHSFFVVKNSDTFSLVVEEHNSYVLMMHLLLSTGNPPSSKNSQCKPPSGAGQKHTMSYNTT